MSTYYKVTTKVR